MTRKTYQQILTWLIAIPSLLLAGHNIMSPQRQMPNELADALTQGAAIALCLILIWRVCFAKEEKAKPEIVLLSAATGIFLGAILQWAWYELGQPRLVWWAPTLTIYMVATLVAFAKAVTARAGEVFFATANLIFVIWLIKALNFYWPS